MYAIIDLETTGGRPEFDRIMEIAIYLHDGEKITGEYSSLVRPGVPIPPFVARLTGISEEMVSSAPTFSEICNEVREVLGDRIFVAHNAPFDHGFLSYQFRAEGIEISNKVLCTCSTSRKVLPGHASYSLGKLCRSVGISLENAHRAAADALATTRLLEMLIDKSGNNLHPFLRDPSKPNPHCQIPDQQLSSLSEKAGILFFKDALGNVIFLAKAWNIRKKAKALTSKFGAGKMIGLGIQAVSADAEITGSRIAASVREHELLQELKPVFNRKFRDGDNRLAVYDEPDEQGYIRISLRPLDNNQQPVAIFSSRTVAHKHLKSVVKDYSLYPEFCGLSSDPLVPTEPPQAYNERAEEALGYFRKQKRSYIITDKGPDPETKWYFIVEDSRFSGYKLLSNQNHIAAIDIANEFRQKNADNAAIIRTMSRHIAKREYLNIEPLPEIP